MTVVFNRYEVPHNPYDLRHAWAVRSIGFIPIELAAQQMGRSIAVQMRTYHKWIIEEVHERHFRLRMERSDPRTASGNSSTSRFSVRLSHKR